MSGKPITFWCDDLIYNELVKFCSRRGISISSFLYACLFKMLSKNDRDEDSEFKGMVDFHNQLIRLKRRDHMFYTCKNAFMSILKQAKFRFMAELELTPEYLNKLVDSKIPLINSLPDDIKKDIEPEIQLINAMRDPGYISNMMGHYSEIIQFLDPKKIKRIDLIGD